MLSTVAIGKLKTIHLVLLGALLVVTGAIGGIALLLRMPLSVPSRQVLFVPEGATMDDVLNRLEQRSVLVAPWAWKVAVRVIGRFVPLSAKIGSYELSPMVTHGELFENILRGRNRLVRHLTIYEGETFPHLAGALARTLNEDSSQVIQLICGDSLVRMWGIKGARSLEGYLLPATYTLYEEEPVEHALRRIVRVFERTWQERFAAKAAKAGLSRHQVVTLASIVEGEVIHPSEYRRIAGVYWNRLRSGMKLQADPTVQYALGFPPRRLVFRDYLIEHPYNTYRITGLPPGPIKAPSIQAIEAVLDPENHSFFYFCNRGDSTGMHRFATTYAEHQRNVRYYHRLLQERQRALLSTR
ncbi:MAG: endolytic transglycosylase MltG [Bacteroidota bacterium]|nr:endolytic transglycosylase MltG [Bacteroidota bacterium]